MGNFFPVILPVNSHKGQLQQVDQSNHICNPAYDQFQQWTLSFQSELNLEVKNDIQVENILLFVYRVPCNANFTSCLAQTPSSTTTANPDMPTDEVKRLEDGRGSARGGRDKHI